MSVQGHGWRTTCGQNTLGVDGNATPYVTEHFLKVLKMLLNAVNLAAIG